MATYFRSWAAYRKGFLLARDIEAMTAHFPQREKHRLADQITRSSRAVCSNLGESFSKRRYPKHFVAKITDAASENCETQVWLDFALDRDYINGSTYDRLIAQSEEIGKLLSYMEFNPQHYATKQQKRPQ